MAAAERRSLLTKSFHRWQRHSLQSRLTLVAQAAAASAAASASSRNESSEQSIQRSDVNSSGEPLLESPDAATPSRESRVGSGATSALALLEGQSSAADGEASASGDSCQDQIWSPCGAFPRALPVQDEEAMSPSSQASDCSSHAARLQQKSSEVQGPMESLLTDQTPCVAECEAEEEIFGSVGDACEAIVEAANSMCEPCSQCDDRAIPNGISSAVVQHPDDDGLSDWLHVSCLTSSSLQQHCGAGQTKRPAMRHTHISLDTSHSPSSEVAERMLSQPAQTESPSSNGQRSPPKTSDSITSFQNSAPPCRAQTPFDEQPAAPGICLCEEAAASYSPDSTAEVALEKQAAAPQNAGTLHHVADAGFEQRGEFGAAHSPASIAAEALEKRAAELDSPGGPTALIAPLVCSLLPGAIAGRQGCPIVHPTLAHS